MADKYDLPQYVTSRVRYYDGEYLKDDEFIDEQKYHIDRRQRHDRLLHVAGVCEGLVPSVGDAKNVKISSGTAIDDLGHTILIDSDQLLAVKADQNGALNIVITFAEVEDRPADGNSAVASNTRFKQAPALQLSAASIAHGVVIGQALVVSGSLSQVTMTNRVYSGLRLPGPSGTAYALHSRGGDGAPGVVDMECSLNVTSNLTVAGALAIGATDASGNKLRVAGNTLLGGEVQVTGSRIKNNTGLGIVQTNAADWLRVNPDSSFPGIALYGNVAIGSGGLAVGEWSQLPAGTLKVTGKATFSVGAVANGLNIGTSGTQATYAWPHESIGTDNPAHNLRLFSGGAVYTHAPKGFIFSKDQGGSGDASIEGTLSFGAVTRQMVNLWNANYGAGVQSNTLYFRTDKNVAFYKAGAHDNAELSPGGGTAMLVINNGNVGVGTAAPAVKLDVNGVVRANRYSGENALVLNDYTTGNPSSNVYLYSPGVDRDAWIYLDSGGPASPWGIYHRQIDSTVKGLPGNAIGFIGDSKLKAYIGLGDGAAYFAGNVGIGTTSPQATLHVTGATFRLADWTFDAGTDGMLYIRYKEQTIARFSNARDKIQLYKNSDGVSPYWYYNNEGSYPGK